VKETRPVFSQNYPGLTTTHIVTYQANIPKAEGSLTQTSIERFETDT
jgi:hypothetical protein